MTRSPPEVLRVAVNAPVRTLFDYLPPASGPAPAPGGRVRVPFGRRRQVGLIMDVAEGSEVPTARLRRADAVLDDSPLFGPAMLELLSWAAGYYAHPIGEVCAAAVPAALRQGRSLAQTERRLALTEAGRGTAPSELERRAPRQAELLALLAGGPGQPSDGDLAGLRWNWRDAAARLVARGLARWETVAATAPAGAPRSPVAGPVLTEHQRAAVEAVLEDRACFRAWMMFGVTGSGKTEAYLGVIEALAAAGRQSLVLVPEIGLTPQIVDRFRRRLGVPVAVLHSGLTDRERLEGWRAARDGSAGVVIGTRSAVFVPLARPGLIVVDEEHDPSYKQQEGFRYSGRDLAVMRARLESVPVVLGSATPSLETFRNAEAGRYGRLLLPERPGAAVHPAMGVIDLRVTPSRQGLTAPLIGAMSRHLEQGGQVILFINRRGYAPALFCCECGWTADCPRCDARMTLHASPERLRCHHCDRQAPPPAACPGCEGALHAVGQGTERVEEAIERQFPGIRHARIDRDTTRHRGALEDILDGVQRGLTRILVGTQMLTKGHDFPEVSLVGVLNADQGLFGTDFRANERLAQTILQVSGRAGRAERPGEVLIQTAYPAHPLLRQLLRGGYEAFAREALADRQAAGWPPFGHLVLLRAEAAREDLPRRFLERCRGVAAAHAGGVSVLGPAPAPMERRSGRYRYQLLLRSDERGPLHRLLGKALPVIEALPDARRVRWSVDVDPAELF